MRFIILGFVISLHCAVSFSDPYIVLFQENELNISSLSHKEFEAILQKQNDKSVKDLKAWMSARGKETRSVQDLWLVRGAKTSLGAADVLKLKKEPWVHGIYEDKIRQYVNPTSSLVVKNTLKELGEDPLALWGHLAVSLDKLRTEYPDINGTGVRVGILDTGIQGRHPEFASRAVFKDMVSSIGNAYDDHGHGTHVAGTISGLNTGFAPKAGLVMAKIFSAVGSGQDSVIIGGGQWVFDPDGDPTTDDYPQVINNSWGGDLPGYGPYELDEFDPFRRMVQAWISGGIVPVFAAGNSGKGPNGVPGGLPEVISVGATTSAGDVAPFSSRGPNLWRTGMTVLSLLKPDISAPGAAIASAFPGNDYATWDGTSMAAPHVTGAIALLLQANHKLDVGDVRELLYKSCTPKMDVNYGYGTLNVHELVKQGIARRQ